MRAEILICAGLVVAAFGDPAGDASATCSGLNITEKLSMMRGYGPIAGYSRNSGCAGVCGRTTFRWDNGPQGFGDGTIPGTTTQFPSSLSIAATFDPELAFSFGEAMGEEFWGKGTNIQEGPGVNVARVMHNGRNFEYMSGEDPVLGSLLLPQVVDGIQQNVMAIVKHYVCEGFVFPARPHWLFSPSPICAHPHHLHPSSIDRKYTRDGSWRSE